MKQKSFEQYEHHALKEIRFQLSKREGLELKIFFILQTIAYRLETITALIQDQQAYSQEPIVDPDAVHYVLLNMENDGVLTYNSTTEQYVVSDSPYMEED